MDSKPPQRTDHESQGAQVASTEAPKPESVTAVAERPREAANPCIEITPSAAQYEQLCRDLTTLRAAGAPSNTVAVLRAVHAAADG